MTQPLNIRDRSTLEAYARASQDGSIDASEATSLMAAAAKSQTRAADLDLIVNAEAGKGLTAEAERTLRQAVGAPTPRQPPPMPSVIAGAKKAPSTPPLPSLPSATVAALGGPRGPIPAPPRHELRAVSADEMREGRRRYDAMMAAQRSQAAMNAVAQTDPFAARVNGAVEGSDGNWSKVSSSPLEMAGMIAVGGTLPGQVYGAIQAGQAVHGAIENPSAGSIAKAALKTGLVVGGAAHTAHLSHGAALQVGVPVAEGMALAESHRPGGVLKKKK
jgi:hypothetical protein